MAFKGTVIYGECSNADGFEIELSVIHDESGEMIMPSIQIINELIEVAYADVPVFIFETLYEVATSLIHGRHIDADLQWIVDDFVLHSTAEEIVNVIEMGIECGMNKAK